MKKLFALCLAAVVALGLAACGGSTSSSAAASEPGTSDAAYSAAASVAAAGKDPANCKIGVIQLTEHVALDAARDGFIDALVEAGFNRENIDVQNAQGEIPNCATIATKFVNDKVDLILAVATPAAQAAAPIPASLENRPLLIPCMFAEPAKPPKIARNLNAFLKMSANMGGIIVMCVTTTNRDTLR